MKTLSKCLQREGRFQCDADLNATSFFQNLKEERNRAIDGRDWGFGVLGPTGTSRLPLVSVMKTRERTVCRVNSISWTLK